jgi:hypothetical protein
MTGHLFTYKKLVRGGGGGGLSVLAVKIFS